MWTNVDEIETLIQNFASTYPAIAERITLPEQAVSAEPGVAPRTVTALRIGVHGAGAVDGALLIFGQHAREWTPPEIALELAGALLGAYTAGSGVTYGGKSYSAPDVQRVLNNVNVFLVPCVNPQGRQHSLDHDTTDAGWRRNRNAIPGSSCVGVDLNRNYDFAFDLGKYFDLANPDVTSHTSDDPCNSNQVYHGPSAFSETETKNVRWLLDTYPRIRWFIDIHGYTFAGEIYYPWGDDENETTNPAMNWRNPAFDHQRGRSGDGVKEYIHPNDLAIHQYLANKIKTGADPVNGRAYITQQSFALYPTAGASDDYVWSRHLVSPFASRVEAFTIEHRASRFKPTSPEREDVIREVASGLLNFCLACACGVPGLTVELVTSNVVFNQCPEGRTSSRPVIARITGCDAATFRVISGPSRTGGSTRINFGTAIAASSVAAAPSPMTREVFLWLTCAGGIGGDAASGTVRVECPEAGFVRDVPITANFVAAPRAGAVLALDRSGSMQDDGGDGRTRLQVLLDSAPAFVEVSPQGARVGLVRFATDEAPGAPMTTMGPEGADPGGRDVIRAAIANHTLATGDASFTSIGDGVFAAASLIGPETGVDFKSLVVLTDGHENRSRYLSDVAGLINNRVFAIGLGTPDQIQPVALQALTNGTNGYMLMTGALDANDPFRLDKYYLQILTGVTNDQVVLDPGGWVHFGVTERIPFYLNEADAAVDAIVLTPDPRLLQVRLQTPSGQVLDQTHPSMTWTQASRIGFYRFALPVPGKFASEGPGRWEMLLDWGQVIPRRGAKSHRQEIEGSKNAGIRYEALVHARSDVEMTVSLSQDSLKPGAKVTLRVRLAQYASIPLDGARVTARVTHPDGAVVNLTLPGAGDGVYESAFFAGVAGVYTVRMTSQGQTLRGFFFTREAVRTAAVWARGDAPPPTGQNEGVCEKLRCLLESGALNPDVLKRLGFDIERALKCCETEERIPGKPR
ncbi:M14 family zinc carboxypeptidase [Methylocystis sp. SB2]|uniref:M14 family zinc carboxypeptidase n=1 Tax=Methylocystis sp. (strain SB2) TaxID=743836 RepID=UPI00040306E9|nr:M14 family zinc carboxypeptidase [Methylocystis sp. SB2]ULO23745.1 VWA domain-containing protein [Methylocystis sp. SB2]